MMRLLKIILAALAFQSETIGQISRQTVNEEQLWLGYFNQTRLSDKWGIWFDAHLRTTDQFIKEPSKAIGRIGLMYYLNDDLKLTNAYNYVNHYPEEAHAHISQPEHRIWHQLQLHTKYGKIRTMQWLRLEERFRRKIKNESELAEGYRFDERIRANMLINIPLSKKGIVPKTFSAIVNDEIFINLSKNNVYNTFDQNRFFVGLAYNITNHSNFQFGYMNVLQQQTAGYKYKNLNTIRLFYFQNLDLRKNKK